MKRDFEFARKYWKPLLDKYNVDLVLNGHDHSYARGHVPIRTTDKDEVNGLGTVYVTSVSGPKQYKTDSERMNSLMEMRLICFQLFVKLVEQFCGWLFHVEGESKENQDHLQNVWKSNTIIGRWASKSLNIVKDVDSDEVIESGNIK